MVLREAGFTDLRWGAQIDVFSGSKHESDASEFGTRGVTFSARKP
jgi:hypothetical protein